ncbi:MAG: tRNA (adenosine(37)-N6)-threonylcarbamoyltransferase complex ATPase subunit type 1 TsaE [Dethiobacteria bacterium]
MCLLLVITSHGEEETRTIGRILGKGVPPGMVIALKGDLGAGKTVLAQGIAQGAGVEGTVNSPSYVLMNIYHGQLELYHFDFYRLEDEDDLFELGLDEYFYGEGVTLVEWADKFPSFLPEDRLEIEIRKDHGEQEFVRHLFFRTMGKLNHMFLEEIKKYASAGD